MTKLESKEYGTIEHYGSEDSIIPSMVVSVIIIAVMLFIGWMSLIAFAQEPSAHALSCSLNACNGVFLTATPTPTTTPIKPSPTPQVNASKRVSMTGKVSHYSRVGCLGCSATLTMANGESLDDNRLTIAFNKLPMNTQVRLTNLDNGKSVVATVTDTGGFEKLGRIADLVPAVAQALETKTDVSNVLIEEL
ncbi:MAG: hypothetical protein MOGMAGMI_01832 [Candidatus Omnitrophica bacterium]|nr:hypothetical protein [Candidatus Omnitrophota bacterium]